MARATNIGGLHPIDKISGAPITEDIVHAHIHNGNHFFWAGYTTINSSATHQIRITTPDTTTHMHMKFYAGSTGITRYEMFEGASGTITGTTITALTSNRNRTNASQLKIYNSITSMTSTGSSIDSAQWGASGNKANFGGSVSREDEIELKQNTDYYIILTSFNDANIIQWKMTWYENPNC